MLPFRIPNFCCIKTWLLPVLFTVLQMQEVKAQESNLANIWNSGNKYLFKTNIKVYGNEFSGLFVIKKTDAEHYRTIFLNEVGMKFFDFEIGAEDDSVLHVFEPLNKTSFIKLLINDYRTLLFLPKTEDCRRLKTKKDKRICKSGTYYYQFNTTDGRLNEIYQRIFFIKPFSIKMTDYQEYFPQKIRLSHKFIKFEQNLYLLENP